MARLGVKRQGFDPRQRHGGYSRGKYELRPPVKKLYQLRPKVSASRVSVASGVFNLKHDELCPAVSKELYQLHRKVRVYKCPTIGGFLHSFKVRYFIHNYMDIYRIVEWYRQYSCYIMLLSNV